MSRALAVASAAAPRGQHASGSRRKDVYSILTSTPTLRHNVYMSTTPTKSRSSHRRNTSGATANQRNSGGARKVQPRAMRRWSGRCLLLTGAVVIGLMLWLGSWVVGCRSAGLWRSPSLNRLDLGTNSAAPRGGGLRSGPGCLCRNHLRPWAWAVGRRGGHPHLAMGPATGPWRSVWTPSSVPAVDLRDPARSRLR